MPPSEVTELEQTIGMNVIARIRSELPTKFGIPRQSGLVEKLESVIVFEPSFRSPEALRGIEEWSHLWLIWLFSENADSGWSPTVRPPRLGGNRRVGVFATRSPFRPNPIGLSCVKLIGTEQAEGLGTVLRVSGADLMDGTPILDIKPYLPLADCKPEASGGFAAERESYSLDVTIPAELAARLPEGKAEVLAAILAQDPRPAYHDDPQRVYGFPFAGFEVKFRVSEGRAAVTDIIPL